MFITRLSSGDVQWRTISRAITRNTVRSYRHGILGIRQQTRE